MSIDKRKSISLFVFLAATVWTAVFWATRLPGAMARPALAGTAGMADLVITVPLIFYLVVVRRGFASWVGLAGVVFTGARAAGMLLPAAEQTYLPAIRWSGVPLELWLLAALIRRLRRSDRTGDVMTRIRNAAHAVIPYTRVADVVAGEIAVFYYALFSWRAKSETRVGWQAFDYAEASGLLNLSTLMVLSLVCEAPLLHVVVSRWSVTAAWILAILDVYGLMWVVAIRRAARLRPILTDAGTLLLRWGLIWELEIPWTNLATFQRVGTQHQRRKEPGYLSMVVMNEPQWVIELKEPAVAHGFLGRRRRVKRIGIAVDEAERFAAAIATTGLR